MPLLSVSLMMVPLQASASQCAILSQGRGLDAVWERTEFLLDNLKNLLVVELARNSLDRGQGLTSIALCSQSSQKT